jgi:hypothetical protein
MANTSFDILFSGELKPGADPAVARARIQALFKLTDEAAERLFSGRAMTVKRGLDADQAARFRSAFLEAGALVQLVERDQNLGELTLAPVDDRPLEPENPVSPPEIDIGHLSLMPGGDWTLEDCDTPPAPVTIPDISHLAILEPPSAEDSAEGSDER